MFIDYLIKHPISTGRPYIQQILYFLLNSQPRIPAYPNAFSNKVVKSGLSGKWNQNSNNFTRVNRR